MPKTLTSSINEDLILPYSGGAWLRLCEIVIPGETTQRIARNTEDVEYDSETYTKGNFEVGEQEWNSEGYIPRVTLKIAHDINHTIEEFVEDTFGALGATVSVIKVGSRFLTTPVAALKMNYSNVATESDSTGVTFTLGIPNPLTQKIPLRSYSCGQCPYSTASLFKGPECQYAGADTTCTGLLTDCKAKGNQIHWGATIGLDPNGTRVVG
jgi:phage-related protein